jgi:hypothetical protein
VKKTLLASAALVAAGLVLSLSLAPAGLSQTVQEVFVTNFPPLQEVHGKVAVEGTVRHGVFVRHEGIVVPPAGRSETTNLVLAGTLDTDGFTAVVLSLQGEVKDTVFVAGKVGTVLIPDEEPVVRALREDERLQFPLEVTAQVTPSESTFFSSDPAPRRVGFPRYRIYLYNSSNKSVEANLYLYLTN